MKHGADAIINAPAEANTLAFLIEAAA
jgi:hypothetical protein